MRKYFSFIINKYPILKYLIYTFKQKDIFTIPHDFKFVKENIQPKKNNILIFTERYWSIHTAWELYIGKILQNKNYNVTVIGCGGYNTFCDAFKLEDQSNSSICINCAYSLKKSCSKFGIKYISMLEFMNNNHNIKSNIKIDLNKEDLESKIVECSTFRHIRSNNIYDDNYSPTKKKFLKSLNNTNNFFSNFLSTHHFDLFFVLNGQFANSNLLIQYSNLLNRKYITYERGNIKNSLVFSVNNNAVPFTMKEIFVEYDNYILNSNDKTKLYNYLNTRDKVGNGHINFFPIIENNISKITAELNINPNSKIYCLFTNLIWDSAVYGQDTIFNNMYEWIKKTIIYFISNPNKHLIIRIHPAETRITWWKTRYTTADFINSNFKNLPSNITIIDSSNTISSYILMKISDIGLIYTSTTGLEMGILNKPVISVANGHYSGLDILYEASSIDHYIKLLNEINLPMPSQVIKIEKYMFLLYFIKMIKVVDIDENLGYHFRIKNQSQINPDFEKSILNIFSL